MSAHAVSHVFFGLNPMWVSTVILAVTYAVIMSEKWPVAPPKTKT